MMIKIDLKLNKQSDTQYRTNRLKMNLKILVNNILTLKLYFN